MTTSFPSGIDSFARPASGDPFDSGASKASTVIDNAFDAIEAIETFLGTGTTIAETIDDRVNTLVSAGTGISKTYDDSANTLTLSVSGVDMTSLTALTGSGIASGDKFLIEDVSADVDKTITANELAIGLATTLGVVGRDKIFDAKGDLPVGTGADTAQKLTAGTDGQVLIATSGATTGLAWSFPIPVVKPSPAYWLPPIAKAWSQFAMTIGDMIVSPIWIPVAGTLDRIGINIQAGTASSVVRLGVYNADANGKPSTLLVDGGTVDGSTSGEKTVTISLAVTPGLYWVAGVNQTAAATLYYYSTSGTGHCVLGIGASTSPGASQDPFFIYKVASTTGALPSTPTFANAQNPLAVFVRMT